MLWSVKRNGRFRSDRGKLCELCDFCASVNHGMRAEVLVKHEEGRQQHGVDGWSIQGQLTCLLPAVLLGSY